MHLLAHLLSHIPQPKHFAGMTAHFLLSVSSAALSINSSASNWQLDTQAPQPMHPSPMHALYPEGSSIFIL
jgi:hypothetical protein